MVSEASWLPFHRKLYGRLLAQFKAEPPTPPADRFLWERFPKVWSPYEQCEAYRFVAGKSAVALTKVEDGDEVLFWTGDRLERQRFDLASFHVGDYVALAERLKGLTEAIESPLIVDLGAGTCIQAVALRAAGCELPVLNLDLFEEALAIGRTVVGGLGLADMAFAQVDIAAALGSPESRWRLKQIILDAAGGRPLVVVSRFAIHPFYPAPDYERLFDFLIVDLGARAGAHLEMCGYHTEAYRTLCVQLGKPLRIAKKTQNEPGDPLAYLERRGDIRVHERQDLWPHYLTTRFPSYLSWTA